MSRFEWIGLGEPTLRPLMSGEPQIRCKCSIVLFDVNLKVELHDMLMDTSGYATCDELTVQHIRVIMS